MIIRSAKDSDAVELARIYNYYIDNTCVNVLAAGGLSAVYGYAVQANLQCPTCFPVERYSDVTGRIVFELDYELAVQVDLRILIVMD